MSKAGIYNLCIHEGSTFGPITFRLKHTVVTSAAVASGATTIPISPASSAYSSGYVFDFNGVLVTLTADVAIGDETLTVSATSSALAANTQAVGNPVDLTGLNARAKIRANYADETSLADIVCAIPNPPTAGEIAITLPSDVQIADNISPLKFAQINDWNTKVVLSKEDRKQFNPGQSPYVWDLETFDSFNPPIVKRRLNGMAAVLAEATS